MSSNADRVLWVRKTRIAHWQENQGFGRLRQRDGSLMIGLGRAGYVRVSRGDHRIQLGQPIFKKG